MVVTFVLLRFSGGGGCSVSLGVRSWFYGCEVLEFGGWVMNMDWRRGKGVCDSGDGDGGNED